MGKTILIAGANGLVGTELTRYAAKAGHSVRHLVRSRQQGNTDYPQFTWDIERDYIEPGALDGVDVVINLAGSNVGDGKWTSAKKREIMDSRVLSTRLLVREISGKVPGPATYIAASAIGYYGLRATTVPFTEDASPGTDFMAQVCVEWEKEAHRAENAGKSLCILRLGVVLANGGALLQMSRPVKRFAGTSLGSGQQVVPWVHIHDVCAAFLMAVDNDGMTGIYNVVAPEIVTNRQLMKEIARIYRKPMLPVGIPGFLLRWVLGEQADIVLGGAPVSPEKISTKGLVFQYPHVRPALEDLLK